MNTARARRERNRMRGALAVGVVNMWAYWTSIYVESPWIARVGRHDNARCRTFRCAALFI